MDQYVKDQADDTTLELYASFNVFKTKLTQLYSTVNKEEKA